MKDNKGTNKFKFVSKEEISNIDNKKEDIVSEDEVKKPYYFGFKQRVFFLVIMIILLFGLGSFLIVDSIKLYKGDTVKYTEVGDSSYKVCLLSNDVYDDSCLNEEMRYNSKLIDNIMATFKYKVNFSEDIDYDLSYHVILYNKIYDKSNKKKLLYEDKEILVDKSIVEKLNKKINISTDAVINYKKYNDFVNNYKLKYYDSIDARLEVVLYLDESDEERKVSSLNIPLGVDTFEIKKNKVNNVNKNVVISNETLSHQGDINIFFGCFLIVISLLLDFRLVRLVRATFTKKSKYEIELEKILDEYDEEIVNVSDDYIFDDNKEVIKVVSFKELLDASKIVTKPILFHKINHLKSEFVVDDEKIYKYVLKEADLED